MTRHLNITELRTIHDLMIAQYGGTAGERDTERLESALAQPSAEYFGVPLHPTLADQAGAYLFHLCQAHAFVDGNKRTALFAMLAFLRFNGLRVTASDEDLFALVVDVAKGNLDKTAIGVALEACLQAL